MFALLLAVLLSISLVGPALAAAPDHRDDYALGRFSDVSVWGDFSSPLTQALAVLALHRADGTDPSPAAVDLLLAQQCDDGGFPQMFRAPSTGDAGPCSSSVDSTAFVVQALDAIGEDAAVQAAAAWLVDVQEDDGSFGGQDGLNANSTGLAALALDLGGETAAGDRARSWVIALQDDCDTGTPGAIPFNADERGSVEIATSQAVLGLASANLGDVDATTASDDAPETGCGETTEELGDPAEAAVAYLVGQLEDGQHLATEFGPSVGGTIDVLFALAAAGVGRAHIDDIADWLPAQAAGYTQEPVEDGQDGAYAGATAKLALAKIVADRDPRDVAGIDLIAQLERLETTELPEVSVACTPESVPPSGDVDCTISGLLAFETVDVTVGLNPTLLDDDATADEEGTATFAFTVPEDATEDDEVTISVDGLGADGLAGLALQVSVDEPEEVDEEDEVTDEEDEEILPETGDRTLLAGGIGLIALLLGGVVLRLGRRQGEASSA